MHEREQAMHERYADPECTVCLRNKATTEYREWQWHLFGVHSIMRIKSAQAVDGRGARTPPFITFTINSKVAVYAPAIREGGTYCRRPLGKEVYLLQAAIREGGTYCRQPLGKEVPTAGGH